MNLKSTLSRVLLGLSLLFVLAQQEFVSQRNYGFYGLQNLAQAHYYNPVFHSNNRLYLTLGVGMMSVGVGNSGFTAYDLLTPRAQDDSLVVSPANAINAMAPLNFLELNMMNEVFGMGIQFKKRYISFSAINRFNLQFAYPKEFFQLLFEGNGGEFLGKRANMDGLGLNFNSYMEYAFGYSQKIGKRFQMGSRVKVLSGIANVYTKKSVLGLTTDSETYALTLDGELDLRTSGIFNADGEFGSPDEVLNRAFNFENMGVSADAGWSFQMTDKLQFNGSVLDVGYIKWTEGNRNLVQDEVNYTFDGLDLQRMFADSNYFEDLQDSISNIFNVQENSEEYTMVLPSRIIVGTNYKVTKFLTVGATYFSDWSVKTYRPSFMMTGAIQFRNWFFLNGHYLISNRSYNNFGLAACVKTLGVQIYVATDNIMAALNPATVKNAHVSFGIGFQLGRFKEESKKKKKEKKDEQKKDEEKGS